GELGRFYAIGITSDEPGYYIAQPIQLNGRVIGVTVVKLNLEWFQRAGGASAEPLMVSDANGVIFLSSVPGWQYRTLRTLPATLRDELGATRQYHGHEMAPLPLQPLASPPMRWLAGTVLGADARLVALSSDAGARPERYLEMASDVGKAGWTLHVMAPLEPV